jgi:archaellum component FlaC
MQERVSAFKDLTDDIVTNIMTLPADELNEKLYQLSDLSWSIRDIANTVNIAKSGGTDMTTENQKPIEEVQKRLSELTAIVTELSKAKAKDKDKMPPQFKCVKCDTEGEPTDKGMCPECGAKMEKMTKTDDPAPPPDPDKLQKAQDLIGELGTCLEGMVTKEPDGEDDVNKGVKQLSADRQAQIVNGMKPLVELLQEVNPDFDLMAAISPPEQSDVEKAVAASETMFKEQLEKAIKDALEPIKKQVDKLKGAQGDSRAEGDDDGNNGNNGDGTEVKKSIWGGRIMGAH